MDLSNNEKEALKIFYLCHKNISEVTNVNITADYLGGEMKVAPKIAGFAAKGLVKKGLLDSIKHGNIHFFKLNTKGIKYWEKFSAVPLGNVIKTNAGQRCDVAAGPCDCGVWH